MTTLILTWCLLLLASLVSFKVEGLCKEGWTFYDEDNTCFKAFGIKDRTERKTSEEAQKDCFDQGGDLIMIKDKDKNLFVSETDGLWETGYYPIIGLTNVASDGYDFKYVDGSDLGEYHPWREGNPDNFGDSEYCVVMYPDAPRHSMQWNDYDCFTYSPYICSVPADAK